MDQFDKQIKNEIKQSLANTIKIEEHEKQRLISNIQKTHKKPGKIRYYAALTAIAILCIVLFVPSIGEMKSNLGDKDEKLIDNHIEKEPVIEEKELPVVEEEEQPVTEEEANHVQDESLIISPDDDTVTIVSKLFGNIRSLFIEAGVKYSWNVTVPDGNQYGSFTESEYGPFAEELSQFATVELVDGRLLDTAKDFCFSGCDAFYFPDLKSGVRIKVTEQTTEQATITFLQPPNFLHFGFEVEATIKKENDTWKLANYSTKSMDLIDYKITKEEADQIAAHNGNATFIKQVEAIHPRSYIIEDSVGTKDMDSTIYIYFYEEYGNYEGYYSDNGGQVENNESLKEYIDEE